MWVRVLAVFLCAFTGVAHAGENYGGFGLGYSEACRTKYEPGFSGGDCISPNLALRLVAGHYFSDYFSLEGSLDTAFSAGRVADELLDIFVRDVTDDNFYVDTESRTNRWAITTLSVRAFVYLPLGDSLRLFAGPSLGGSVTNFDYDVDYFGNGDEEQHSATEFGLNYGGAMGVDFIFNSTDVVRLQWQNWRSLDANVAVNGEFNSNSLTLNFISTF